MAFFWNRDPGGNMPRPANHSPESMTARCEVIGRGHAGKTALFRAMAWGPLGAPLPSGLHLDLEDPQMVARLLQQAADTCQRLRREGLPPTLEAVELRHTLFEGECPRVRLVTHEVIGQVLTCTTPDSPPDQQQRYREYLGRLTKANVLWTVIPCPPASSSPADRERYDRDVKITGAYLRESLRQRASHSPVAVAIVLSKLDSLVESAKDARTALPENTLKQALAPLVNAVLMSAKVVEAAIFACSAFGFGNAVRKPVVPAESGDEEPEWVLRPEATVEPFNLTTLTVWTLLQGLLPQEVECPAGGEPELARIVRMLAGDMKALSGWVVPVKGRSV